MRKFHPIILLLFCTVLFYSKNICLAETCNESSYPDQYYFNGCDNTSILSWDWSNTPIELDPNSNVTIQVTGGKGPYLWTVNGNGFYLDQDMTLDNMVTNTPSVTLYAINACGPCEITVTDVCGATVSNSVRSSGGHWVKISSSTLIPGLKGMPHTDLSQVYSCADQSNVWCMTYSSSGPTYHGVGENGRYRVVNWRYHKYYGRSGLYSSCDSCSNPPAYGHMDDVPGFPYDWCWVFGGSKPYNCDYIRYRDVFEWQCN